jgi:hypothetical protein
VAEDLPLFNGTIRTMRFHRFSLSGGVNRNQPIGKRKIHHQITRPEIALNKYMVPRRRLGEQPVSDRGQKGRDLASVRRDAAPNLLNISGHVPHLVDAQGRPRIRFLLFRERVIENQKQFQIKSLCASGRFVAKAAVIIIQEDSINPWR